MNLGNNSLKYCVIQNFDIIYRFIWLFFLLSMPSSSFPILSPFFPTPSPPFLTFFFSTSLPPFFPLLLWSLFSGAGEPIETSYLLGKCPATDSMPATALRFPSGLFCSFQCKMLTDSNLSLSSTFYTIVSLTLNPNYCCHCIAIKLIFIHCSWVGPFL